MNIKQDKQDLEKTLRQYLENTSGRAWLQSLDETTIGMVADKLIRENTFGDQELLNKTIYGVWGEPALHDFIRHTIWCAHREALHRGTHPEKTNQQIVFQYSGIEHLQLTIGRPTIIVSPMTICTDDAVDGILSVFKKYQPSRKIIFYGENMDSYLERHPEHRSLFATDTISGIRQILSVLREGGVFLTYPDFVYNNHKANETQLFGRPRPISAGLLKIATHTNAILLPAVMKRISHTIQLCFFGSITQTEAPAPTDSKLREQVLAIVISRLLEALILQVPAQWRLLPTLSHEAAEVEMTS
ncbi:MAG: hypothetical protein ABWZ25_06495 [Chitinophagaceae bacterium]